MNLESLEVHLKALKRQRDRIDDKIKEVEVQIQHLREHGTDIKDRQK
jgi:chaperonin cofactor prefoldin